VKWRMPGIGNSTGGEWSSSLSCMYPTGKSFVVATEISLTRQRVRQFGVYRRQTGDEPFGRNWRYDRVGFDLMAG
jgi:hypothetical protein